MRAGECRGCAAVQTSGLTSRCSGRTFGPPLSALCVRQMLEEHNDGFLP